MLTIGTTLAIFLMLGISSLGLFLAKRLNLPHTVLLVLIGIGLGFLAMTDTFSFLGEFQLTPELLFFLLLPTLIFESAYNMSIRKLVADGAAVFSLAIGSFLISTAIITGLLHVLLLLIGIDIPLSITLLFGALISATDPVAVLALFKEYGVPRRLSLIFEGESLFNDATAVAVFLITLEALNHGGLSVVTSITGFLTFSSMLVFGVIFGLLIGGLFTYLVGAARESETASITLTIVLAHITFILAEVISHIEWFGTFSLHISPIISTTIASLIMGNYARTKLNPHAESFVTGLWEQFAFMANSLVFILIGLLMVEVPLFEPQVFWAILITILVVAVARALSIYPVMSFYNLFQSKARTIPKNWQHLMAWGSLRGALAVTMVLLIPEDLSVPGWNLELSPRDFLLAITIGCIAATLFIKATTIKTLVRRFKLDKLTAVEEIEYQEAQAIIHHQVNDRLAMYEKRGYIDEAIAHELREKHQAAFHRACEQACALSQERRNDLAFRVLRIYAIGIEKRHLKLLYDHNEVTESVFRRIQGKLRLQLEAIENGNLSPDVTIHADERDVFERLFHTIKKMLHREENIRSFEHRYMYYRAQAIISRKVLKELTQLEKVSDTIFTSEAVTHVNDLYTSFKENSQRKLQELSAQNANTARTLAESLAKHGVHTIEETVLDDIYRKELITPKLYILLKEELREASK
ncbi:MAG: sodium:proton antiporter [Candidatus Kaiserbacteria bacterium]|nr:sodium:proton antiporter [Candidatus Kaiserbacteria bacterium]MCB9816214.1 sodium:proton antiporter [Candidatus Nomurabacteria bacterium]